VAKRKYTPEQKQEALASVVAVGQSATAKQMGIPVGTVSVWARRAGVKASYVEKMREATEAKEAKNKALRAELHGLLLEQAVKLMKRMDDPHIDFKPGGALGPVEVTFPVAPAAACQHYATSVGILIDKYRLENGEVTGREEVRHDFSSRSTDDLIAEAESILRDAATGS
jgi:transposase-like protein